MKVGFIGSGKMAEAMIASLLTSNTVQAHELFVSDNEADRRRLMKRRYGINTYSNNRHVAGTVEVLFLSVKPQQLDAVLKEIADDITKKQLIISLAAGKKISFIESYLSGARVIRVMPNLPCVVAEGMSAFAAGAKATVTDRRTASKLLSCFGRVLEIPEDQ
ncbi:MAG: NAD(P)-binding domain-containing protein, partial [Lentisphaerae bacterium]|nr:NAD(P)-binding domain-containing protein [Lentisphaerota bacterium]